jgi:Xaa-Pro aminopeptidase
MPGSRPDHIDEEGLTVDYARYALTDDETLAYPSYPLERDFPKEEYELRIRRARELMAATDLDALVITSSVVGRWFTSSHEPHNWHDQTSCRSSWFILTPDADYLYTTPTNNHNLNTQRRATWVTNIRPIVERSVWPRTEIWGIDQMPKIFADLRLDRMRLGFELGDNMTLGMAFNDFLRLRDLLPNARLVDGSPVVRRLLTVQTPLEIERTRRACQAGVWIHDQVPSILRPGLTERDVLGRLSAGFAARYGTDYAYRPTGNWDVRNADRGDYNLHHHIATDRVYHVGDQVCRGTSGASYLGYNGDVDRVWYLGDPPPIVRETYKITWECNRAMAEEIRPGNRCSDVYAALVRVTDRQRFARPLAGRNGHGIHNTGEISVHPDNQTVLEPGMIVSVEPMFGNRYGYYDVEDQYLVTPSGREPLHDLAPEELPLIPIGETD